MKHIPQPRVRTFWTRHPATRVVPDKRKLLSRNWCRRKGRVREEAPAW